MTSSPPNTSAFDELIQMEPLVLDAADLVTRLTTGHESERLQIIESYARSLPQFLSVEEQATLGALFEAAVRREQLPRSLLDIFWDNLPDPVELQSPVEYEPVPEEEIIQAVPVYELPPYFDPSIIVHQSPQKQQTAVLGSGTPAALIQIRNLAADLSALQDAFLNISGRLFFLTAGRNVHENEYKIRGNSLLDNYNKLEQFGYLPDPTEITLEGGALVCSDKPTLRDEMIKLERLLSKVMENVFQSEKFLIAQVLSLTTRNNTKFIGICLRYEMARYRHALKHTIANLSTERLRQVCIPSTNLPDTVAARPCRGDPLCPICCQKDEGENPPLPAVTYTCCQRAFHVDCLLSWLLLKVSSNKRMSCPMCRAEMSLEYLGEVMTMKTVEMQCL